MRVTGTLRFSGTDPAHQYTTAGRRSHLLPWTGGWFRPGPVDGSAADTDPSGAHPEGRDPSVIFNFKGFVGVADLNLTGTGTDLQTGANVPYGFHTDMRFMDGVFVGTDLIERHGSFVFV